MNLVVQQILAPENFVELILLKKVQQWEFSVNTQAKNISK